MENRFILIHSGDMISVYVDKETGIEYAAYHNCRQGGLTIILDSDGKPKVNHRYKNK